MIKGNVASFDMSEKTILVGDVYFVQTYNKRSDTEEIKTGDVVGLIQEEGLAKADGSTIEAIGIALSDSPKKTNDAVNVVVFGKVKKSEVHFADDDTKIPLLKNLRGNGIYLV